MKVRVRPPRISASNSSKTSPSRWAPGASTRAKTGNMAGEQHAVDCARTADRGNRRRELRNRAEVKDIRAEEASDGARDIRNRGGAAAVEYDGEHRSQDSRNKRRDRDAHARNELREVVDDGRDDQRRRYRRDKPANADENIRRD